MDHLDTGGQRVRARAGEHPGPTVVVPPHRHAREPLRRELAGAGVVGVDCVVGHGSIIARLGQDGRVTVVLRPLTVDDGPDVLALNEEVVHKLAPMDAEAYRWWVEQADLA